MVDRPNRLAWIIEDGDGSLKKVNWAKGLFLLKSVIAHVVKACVPEYASFSHELIANECLEDFQDDSGRFHPEFAKALLTNRPLPNGFKMDCDLLFKLNPPICLRGEWKPQLLDIEIQNDSRKLDRCIGRGMLYASGLYYMEYDIIYTYPKFEDSWKVNSVWICPSAPDDRQGTILDFRTKMGCDPPGSCNPCIDFYDKLRLTMVNVGSDSGLGQKDIRGFVWALTTPVLSSEERKKILKEEFEMGMTQTVEESIDVYDWFLDMYGRKHYAADIEQSEKRGLEKGKKFGLEEGKKLGLEEGKKLGLEEGEKLGFEKGKREDVLNMLKKKKYSLDEISEITGLSEEEILQIAKDNNLV